MLIASAVAITLVAGSGIAVAVANTVRERQRIDRVVASPGGVRPLGDEARQVWGVDTDTGPLAVMTGGVVVARSGTEIIGVEAQTGAERWRVELGGPVECGPTPGSPAEWARPTSRLVCLSGPDSERVATVVDATGVVVGRRTLEPITFRTVASSPDGGSVIESSRFVRPGDDGGLLVVERTGERPPDLTFENEEEAFDVLDQGLERGQGAVVRMEDAVSGEVRWEHEVPFRPVTTLGQCAALTHLGSSTVVLAAQTVVMSRPGLVTVSSCGVDAAFTSDGDSLGDVPDGGVAQPASYVDGGYVMPVTPTNDALLDDAGKEVVSLPGRLEIPMATDGTGGETLLVIAESQALVAVDSSGRELWNRRFSESPTGSALVRADGVVVVADALGGVYAIDLVTGKDRWAIEPGKLLDSDTDAWPMVRFAATDGRSALIAVGTPDDAETRLVKVDLRTGRVGWEARRAGGYVALAAVGGTLVERVGTGTTTIEDLGDDSYVELDPGTLTGLGGT